MTVLKDTTAPSIYCPSNMVANTDPGQCSKTNVTFVVTAKDDCDPNPVITCNPTNGSTFQKGVTTVNCTATDASGNSTNCSFTVTISDKELPSVNCPLSIIANTDPGQCSKSNVLFTATASDNCPGVTVSCSPPSGSTFLKGVTTVTCTAVDASSNTNRCNFTVTILDQEPPSIRCSTNIVVDSSNCMPVVVTYPMATVTDNCGVTNIACVPPSGSLFPVGTNIVQCTAWDSSGNSNTCSFTVTVTCHSKWFQLPDLSQNGFDVRALRPKILADDFFCTKSGPITNIHIWASWLNDLPDPMATFQLGFWSDVPGSTVPSGELIANGTFEQTFTNAGYSGSLDVVQDFLPPGWYRQETFSGGLIETSSISPITANGPSAPGYQAAAFRRSWSGESGDWTAIYQNLSINATQYSALTLSLDVRVWSHDLEAGGHIAPKPSFEWPAVVEVDYVDTNGVGQIWRYGWYLYPPGDFVTGQVNDPGQGLIPFYNDQLVQPGMWVPNSFNLFNELPQVKTITRILVGGSGWNFASDIDNVSIHGTVTNMFSHPGNLLWVSNFLTGQYSIAVDPGLISQPFYDTNYGEIIGSDSQVWQYDFPVVQTNAAFWQTNGNIYWLSVSAQSLAPGQPVNFGWKTAVTNWNDDAVFGHVDDQWIPLGDWHDLVLSNSIPVRSLDLAFNLATMWVVARPVITNIVVTNQVTPLATNQVIGLGWTCENGVHYQVLSATNLHSGGTNITWSACGPEIVAPSHWYWETNAAGLQRFYRVVAVDP